MSTPDRQTNPPEPGYCFLCDDEKYVPCPECRGRGWIKDQVTCPQCNGEREIECPYCK